MTCKPLESLHCDDGHHHKETVCVTQQQGYGMGGAGALLLWFIVIAVIAWFLLWSLRPVAVQRYNAEGQPTGEVDGGKVLVGALVIALIIVIIIWIIRAAAKW